MSPRRIDKRQNEAQANQQDDPGALPLRASRWRPAGGASTPHGWGHGFASGAETGELSRLEFSRRFLGVNTQHASSEPATVPRVRMTNKRSVRTGRGTERTTGSTSP